MDAGTRTEVADDAGIPVRPPLGRELLLAASPFVASRPPRRTAPRTAGAVR